MDARIIGLIAALVLACPSQVAAQTMAQAQAEPKSEPKPATEKDTKKKQPKKAAATESKDSKDEAKNPTSNELQTMAAEKLPKDIRALHACAAGQQAVEVGSERFAKSTMFIVSCPTLRGALTPYVVYVARDARGTGAKRVTFEILGIDGAPTTADSVFSVVPSREVFTQQQHMRTRNDPPWISGAWGPDDRPGVCAIAANWRVQGDKAELRLWDEARECPKNELPKYESKLSKKPPPLVGR